MIHNYITYNREREGERAKFKPATFVNELRAVAKTLLSEEEVDHIHLHLFQLPAQSAMARSWGESSPELWVKAVQGLPPEAMKFAINAAMDTLSAQLLPGGHGAEEVLPEA